MDSVLGGGRIGSPNQISALRWGAAAGTDSNQNAGAGLTFGAETGMGVIWNAAKQAAWVMEGMMRHQGVTPFCVRFK